MKVIVTDGMRIWSLPDSAVEPARRGPWFVPDLEPESGAWTGIVALTARIERMGKSIPADRATAYYDGLEAALVTTDGCDCNYRDASFVTGDKIAPCADGQLRIDADGQKTAMDPQQALAAINGCIAQASLKATLKTGDLVAVLTGPNLTLREGHDITVTINGATAMQLKIR